MPTLKYLLEVAGFVLMAAAAAILLHDLYRLYRLSNLILNNQPHPAEIQLHWRSAGSAGVLAVASLLTGFGIR